MQEKSAMALVGLVFGAVFLVLAIVSTVSKVTVNVFNPWLGHQIRHREYPRTFIAVVFLYWLLGVAAVAITIVSVLSAK
jgi:hypothetical protein